MISVPANRKKGLAVIPIDLNSNGILEKEESFYNSLDVLLKKLELQKTDLPPTGDLTLIYKDDKPEVKAFVNWILAKGQQYNHQLGFLSLESQAK